MNALILIAAASVATPAPLPAPVEKAGAEHYVWGGVNDGWHLVKRDDLSVIEERILPGSSEVRHYHARARQFFYVLSGELTMEAAGQTHKLMAGQGIEIAPGVPHQAQNRSDKPVEILVTSSPKSHGDRVEAPLP
ncbi:cupin domain-containing protein [Sphingobium sp. CR2-8]|uniref:cupin domain-containing protein n=1 Tax=Sphingobium sp. CR2-8 TaxID=1306534 RepID=UPI002DB80918|nr:cupin domain-containing protein [Sphingobium sp. CR2-8]MEC3911067.1 cupin domain-containing protein [Sphingobium sp. CR2-8]